MIFLTTTIGHTTTAIILIGLAIWGIVVALNAFRLWRERPKPGS